MQEYVISIVVQGHKPQNPPTDHKQLATNIIHDQLNTTNI